MSKAPAEDCTYSCTMGLQTVEPHYLSDALWMRVNGELVWEREPSALSAHEPFTSTLTLYEPQ